MSPGSGRSSNGGEGRMAEPATHLKDHPGLLQQVGPHVGPNDVVLLIKADLDVLPESAAIVVASGLGVPNGLDQQTIEM